VLNASAPENHRSCVIVAGDHLELARYAAQLCAARCDFVAAHDGQEAFEAALAWHADLVFSDVTMPVLDGFGLLRRLRSHPATSSTPVILILSPQAGEEAWLESLDLGGR
jgi:CheY-like chemotaxis protein